MIREYIKSCEMYMGYKIETKMIALGDDLQYHKSVTVYTIDGKSIASGKNKKELKELIKGGYIR